MRTRMKLVLASVTAGVLLSALVGVASAQRLEISNRSVRVKFPRLAFAEPEGTSIAFCEVTMEGSFHSRTITKAAESLVGYISRAVIGAERCGFFSGAERIEFQAASLPWHVRYESFAGALPNITRVNFRFPSIAFRVSGAIGTCLYRATTAQPARAWLERMASGQIPTLTFDGVAAIPGMAENSFLCPRTATVGGVGLVHLLASLILVFLRLI